jgi:hypothetical protein
MKEQEPIDVEALMPADTPRYMLPAWLGCISFAISNDECMKAFRVETGNRWTPGRSGIERMIDEATGIDRAFIEEFIGWVNVNIWGPIDGPSDERSGDAA